MAGAGVLVSLLLGITSDAGKILIVALVGVLMILYVTIGGMKGTTWVQMVKAVLLIAGTLLITFLILLKFNFNISDLLGTAASNSGKGAAFLEPGLKYGADSVSKLDFISLGIALVLGTAGLPHILIRFYTVPTAKAARKSVNWAIGIIGAFYLMTIVLGFGAAAILKPGDIIASNKAGNTAAPLAALEIGGGSGSTGGAILLAVISAVAFATILAVVAGLTLASSSSFAHDIYANVIRRGQATEKEEVRAARWATVAIGVVSIGLGALARDLNVAGLVALAFAVAASANLPTILYSLFWKRFTTQGALWSIYGGLASSVLLVLFSPVVSSKPTSMFPDVDFAWFPLENPGLISIPLGFLLGWVGSLLSRRSPTRTSTPNWRSSPSPASEPTEHTGTGPSRASRRQALRLITHHPRPGRVVESYDAARPHLVANEPPRCHTSHVGSGVQEATRATAPPRTPRGRDPLCSSTPTTGSPPTCACHSPTSATCAARTACPKRAFSGSARASCSPTTRSCA